MIAKSSQITYYGYFHYLAFYSYIWFVFYNSDNKSWVLWNNHMTYKLLPFWNLERKILLLQQSHHWQIKPALIDQIKLFINRTFKNYSLVQLKNQSSNQFIFSQISNYFLLFSIDYDKLFTIPDPCLLKFCFVVDH